jgi:predicted nucleic acid-binding protein
MATPLPHRLSRLNMPLYTSPDASARTPHLRTCRTATKNTRRRQRGEKRVPHYERTRARAAPFGAAVAALAEESVAVALPEAPDAVELVGSESALVGVSVRRHQPTDAVHLAKAQARRTKGAKKERRKRKKTESLNRRIER